MKNISATSTGLWLIPSQEEKLEKINVTANDAKIMNDVNQVDPIIQLIRVKMGYRPTTLLADIIDAMITY